MALSQVRLTDSFVSKVSGSDSMQSRLPVTIPEDGLDSDDEDLQQSHITTNWIVRKTFLELTSNEKDSLRMRLHKTDSCLTADRSTTTGSHDKESSEFTMCSSTSSTRESSTDDAIMTRQKSVRFGDAEMVKEVQQMERVPSIINVSSLESDFAPVRRSLSIVGADSEKVCRISSRLSIESRNEAEQPFGRFCSIMTDMSPRSRAHTAEDLGFMAARESCSPRKRVQHEHCPAIAAPSVEPVSPQRAAPIPPIVQLVPTPMMVFSPCVAQVSTQKSAPAAPPGKFSQPASAPRKEQDEFVSQRWMLQEQRRRLMSMSGAYNGTPTWTMPVAQKPPGSWNQSKGQSHARVRQRGQTEVKPHERTTLVLRDLPEGFSRDMVADLLSSQGFGKKFDFVYTPVKFSDMATIGYAFVNFVSGEAARDCLSRLDGFTDWPTPCENSLTVLWSEKDQGLPTIIDRHRNSPVMHASVREEFKPALYVNGVKTTFPRPTKHVKPPRVQRYRDDANADGDEELS